MMQFSDDHITLRYDESGLVIMRHRENDDGQQVYMTTDTMELSKDEAISLTMQIMMGQGAVMHGANFLSLPTIGESE